MSETEQKMVEPTPEEATGTATAVEAPAVEATDVATAEAPVPTEAPERKKGPAEGSRSYELIFLVDAGLPKEELNAVIEKVQSFLERNDGVVDNIRVSDVRRLTYEIKKRTHGIYVVVNFWQRPHFIAELERLLRLEERVLRHMVIQVRA